MRKSSRHRHKQSRTRALFRFVVGLAWSILCIGLLVGGVYAVYDYVNSSKDFKVQFIEVHGLIALDIDRVAEKSGITTDDSIFALDLDAAEARIKELSYVSSCKVTVEFPDLVIINVVEREPIASLHVNNRIFAIDREGYPLREFQPHETPIEPYLTNVEGVDFVEYGQRIDTPALQTALLVWDAYSMAGPTDDLTVSEIAAFRDSDIRMYCDEFSYEIRWGRGDHLRQARRLAAFCHLRQNGIICKEYIDLRFAQAIACK